MADGRDGLHETYVVAIDAGTTGIRARAIAAGDSDGVSSYREFTQYFPQPGWVEHDAAEIWEAVRSTLSEVIERVGVDRVACIGITNQRETVVAWDRTTGAPYGRAIVWQDRRTAARCDALTVAGQLDLVRHRTGLVLDPYFSAHEVRVAAHRGWCAGRRTARPRNHRLVDRLEPDRRGAPRQ